MGLTSCSQMKGASGSNGRRNSSDGIEQQEPVRMQLRYADEVARPAKEYPGLPDDNGGPKREVVGIARPTPLVRLSTPRG